MKVRSLPEVAAYDCARKHSSQGLIALSLLYAIKPLPDACTGLPRAPHPAT